MNLTEWIVQGEVGVSSKTMWAALMGVFPKAAGKGFTWDVPHDPDDFRRCMQFVEACQITMEQLQKIKEIVPWFAPIIDNWGQLVTMYVSHGNAELYNRLQELEKEAMILDGWIEKSPGYWIRENK
jgi:hypothetical protein